MATAGAVQILRETRLALVETQVAEEIMTELLSALVAEPERVTDVPDAARGALLVEITVLQARPVPQRSAKGIVHLVELQLYWQRLADEGLWDEFFHYRIDEIPGDVQDDVKAWFFHDDVLWHDIYTRR